SVDDEFTSQTWEPALPGDKATPAIRRETLKYDDFDIVWPKLSWQVCPRDAVIINDKLVEIGNKVYAPGYMDLWPKNIEQFSTLFNSIGGQYPWRLSITIEGDGLSAVAVRGTI